MNAIDTSYGNSNYHLKKIQVYHIWEAAKPNPWRGDIIKRLLRNKTGNEMLDLEKIDHICQYLIENPASDYYFAGSKPLDIDLISEIYDLPDWKVKALTLILTTKVTESFRVTGLKLIQSLVSNSLATSY